MGSSGNVPEFNAAIDDVRKSRLRQRRALRVVVKKRTGHGGGIRDIGARVPIGCVGIEVLRASKAVNEVRQDRERSVARKIAIPDEVNIVRPQHDWPAMVLNAVAGDYRSPIGPNWEGA